MQNYFMVLFPSTEANYQISSIASFSSTFLLLLWTLVGRNNLINFLSYSEKTAFLLLFFFRRSNDANKQKQPQRDLFSSLFFLWGWWIDNQVTRIYCYWLWYIYGCKVLSRSDKHEENNTLEICFRGDPKYSY